MSLVKFQLSMSFIGRDIGAQIWAARYEGSLLASVTPFRPEGGKSMSGGRRRIGRPHRPITFE